MDLRRAVAGLGRALIAAGVLILLFVAYQLWGTGLAEARSQDRLRSDFLDGLQVTPGTTPTGEPGVPDEPAPAPSPPVPGDAVAIVRIPKIGVEKAVVEGVTVPALKQGPGHYPSTPMPGQPGNAAIAGHRTTYGAPFFKLDELVPGDDVLVTTGQGDFTYRVVSSSVVRPSQNEVLAPSEQNLLTLTTCHPRYSARQRLIVVAELVEDPAPAPAMPPPLAEVEAPVGTDALDEASVSGEDAARGPAVAWGALAAAVWLVTWLLSRRWGRIPAYAMGTPVFLVVLFVFFENFARLLPANI